MNALQRSFLKAMSALALILAVGAPGAHAQQYPVNSPASSSGGTRQAVASINLTSIQNDINYISNVANNAQNIANNANNTANWAVQNGNNAWNQANYATSVAQNAQNVATGYGSFAGTFEWADPGVTIKGVCLRGYPNNGRLNCPNGTGPVEIARTSNGGSGGL